MVVSGENNINFSAYRYAESVVGKFTTICEPLLKLNIKIFAYFRFFNNGKYLYLCNNLDWVRFCLENIHDNEGTSLGKEIGYAPEDNYHCFLWPMQKTDYLMTALYDFNIWNGLSIFKQKDDSSIELWGFATERHVDNMQNFYVENIDLLKDFTASFNINAADIIVPTNENLALYKNFKPQDHSFDEYEMKKIKKFIQATSINKYPIITNNEEIFLSNKELQCVNLLALGKTAKQIALDLKVSPRTIEKNLENVKNKINCGDKEVIIKIYKNSVLQWL